MPIRFVQALFMLVCLTVAVAFKWVWPETERFASTTSASLVSVDERVVAPTAQPKPALPMSFQASLNVAPSGSDETGDGSANKP